ncbi:hypothetical protein IAQ61_000208 [Plenodomus lingam]|nr:hypothetical protein IAQ61_000208 [Plenodomus lingam]
MPSLGSCVSSSFQEQLWEKVPGHPVLRNRHFQQRTAIEARLPLPLTMLFTVFAPPVLLCCASPMLWVEGTGTWTMI